MSLPASMFGVSQPRSEDPRFLRGRGRYLENVDAPGAIRVVFVRSIMPHALVSSLETAEAVAIPGVIAVYTAEDLRIPPQPPSGNVEGGTGTLEGSFDREPLARDRVRFVGEPVAAIAAETLSAGLDAAELVRVGYEPLEVVNDPAIAAGENAPLLWPEFGTNVCFEFGYETMPGTDPLADAEVVVVGRFVNQRVAPVPMEANGILVVPEANGRYTAWVSTQVPFDVRSDLADVLGVDKKKVRTIAPDVGGGFGAKGQTYPEYLVVAAVAKKLGRPARWFESRSESMLGLAHGRAQLQRVEIGAKRDGTLVGMRVDLLADMGAYPVGAFLLENTETMVAGVYAFPAIATTGRCVVTNTTPVSAYRGAGRPEAAALVERSVDMLAYEIGMDPVDLRRRNLIPADAFPYTTAAGTTYDIGDYTRSLDEALRIAGYADLRREQAERRSRGDRVSLGIGVSTYVEITAFASKEFGSVEVDRDGSVTVLTGLSAHGQGHETALAQLASGVLGVDFETVRVVHSDTGVVPRGAGTWGSRSLQVGGSAVVEQAQAVASKARRLASHLLEVDEADLAFDDGRVAVAGAPQRSLTWAELASAAAVPASLPEGMEPGLASSGTFREAESTFPFGAHVAVVEVDTETGDARALRHVAVDDCGRILNPMLVDGQVHGGLGQGIAQALFEEMVYDEEGNPVTGNLTTYLMPSAAELPRFETTHTETPTPLNPLGAKGIGESATVGSTPAVQNAVVDAVSHLGVRHIDMPLTPERVWRAIREAAGRR